uniref:Uncharacterized protein n=1 Tax=Tanacetum cinerariifolium TaxID=118510 RepID=A0A699GNZ5_TANCI|nr:hypothetical protein [Tanacetum cinerariifolium]
MPRFRVTSIPSFWFLTSMCDAHYQQRSETLVPDASFVSGTRSAIRRNITHDIEIENAITNGVQTRGREYLFFTKKDAISRTTSKRCQNVRITHYIHYSLCEYIVLPIIKVNNNDIGDD